MTTTITIEVPERADWKVKLVKAIRTWNRQTSDFGPWLSQRSTLLPGEREAFTISDALKVKAIEERPLTQGDVRALRVKSRKLMADAARAAAEQTPTGYEPAP